MKGVRAELEEGQNDVLRYTPHLRALNSLQARRGCCCLMAMGGDTAAALEGPGQLWESRSQAQPSPCSHPTSQALTLYQGSDVNTRACEGC